MDTNLSVKELKALIESANLSHHDCIDKDDLRARAREAAARLAASTPKPCPAPSSGTLARKTSRLAGYDCLLSGPADVLSGAASADFAMVVLHGLGASSSDFADLPLMMGSDATLSSKRMLYVFPQAPSSALGMPAWWEIDVMKFLTVQTAGPAAMASLIREEPPGLREARASLSELLAEARRLGGGGGGATLTSKQLLIGGFSQGAMTSLDLALHQPAGETPAGVAFLSGAPIVVEQWAERLPLHKDMPVFISHGQADPTLPFAASGWVHELLKQHALPVEYNTHTGGHTLGDDNIVRRLTSFVSARVSASGQPPVG